MDNSRIALKPVKDLLGMNFFIPDYQRGYRWTKQLAEDLLNDIWEFSQNTSGHTKEIYCVQPLVVQKKEENIRDEIIKRLEDDPSTFATSVEKILKGCWNVVDGQQRLTTIYLILTALGEPAPYEIDYETRHGSKDFLKSIQKEETCGKASNNIDYFHMYNVYNAAVDWLKDLGGDNRKRFQECLLNKVNFIWYQIPDKAGDNRRTEAIAAFERLNIGKIPLTDAELVKALFLNRTNFDYNSLDLEMQQRKIATEWDQIEYALQDDAFWLFLHNKGYEKPTRIDFILDLIRKRDPNQTAKESDEHQTFRYFYKLFKEHQKDILKEKWEEICDHFHIFNEWFHDYKLYHYIGYLRVVSDQSDLIANLVAMWKADSAQKKKVQKDFYVQLDGSKAQFIEAIKGMIYAELKKIIDHQNANCSLKYSLESSLDHFKYDEEYKTKSKVYTMPKSKCVPILLLHNIETIIQQNEKLVEDAHFGLPNFTRFPFHLYKAEKWEVEHIRPNAGDKLEKPEEQETFLKLAMAYLPNKDNLHTNIQEYLNKTKESAETGVTTVDSFAALLELVLDAGDALSDADKNKIWNYTLLDKKTNIQYSNAIFPVKRAFLANKERGYKTKIEGGKLNRSEQRDEIAFVLPCTRNVFAKFYTDEPNGLLSWTEQDAQAYLADMKDKLAYYIERSRGEKS